MLHAQERLVVRLGERATMDRVCRLDARRMRRATGACLAARSGDVGQAHERLASSAPATTLGPLALGHPWPARFLRCHGEPSLRRAHLDVDRLSREPALLAPLWVTLALRVLAALDTDAPLRCRQLRAQWQDDGHTVILPGRVDTWEASRRAYTDSCLLTRSLVDRVFLYGGAPVHKLGRGFVVSPETPRAPRRIRGALGHVGRIGPS